MSTGILINERTLTNLSRPRNLAVRDKGGRMKLKWEEKPKDDVHQKHIRADIRPGAYFVIEPGQRGQKEPDQFFLWLCTSRGSATEKTPFYMNEHVDQIKVKAQALVDFLIPETAKEPE